MTTEMAIYLGLQLLETSLRFTRALEARNQPAQCAAHLFNLAPDGACRAASVARSAVRSYRTFSPLPPESGGLFSVALSLRLLSLGITQHRVSAELGLSSLVT